MQAPTLVAFFVLPLAQVQRQHELDLLPVNTSDSARRLQMIAVPACNHFELRPLGDHDFLTYTI